MLSRACQYGILTAVYLAGRGRDGFIAVHVVAADLGLSPHFLAKIVQQVTATGIFSSYRGPNGGVALGRSPSRIRLRDLVEAIDGMGSFESCLLGLPGCGVERPCPLHDSWSVIRAGTVRMLDETTIADLAERIGGERLRLTAMRDSLDPNTRQTHP